MGNMTLKAYLELYDRMSKPLQGVNKAVNTARDAMKGMKKELDELKRAQSDVSAYKRVQSELDKTAAKLKEATAAETRYAREVKNSLAPNKAAQEQLAKTRDALDKLKAIESEQLSKLQTMQERLKAAGIETKDLAQSESILAAKIKTAGQAMDAQRAKITSLAIAQRKLTEANEKHQETMGRLNSARSAGFESALAGGAVLHGMHKLVEPAQEWGNISARMRAAGTDSTTIAEFQDVARKINIKGISENSALESISETNTMLRDKHEALTLTPDILKAKSALTALYGGDDTDEQVKAFLKVIELRQGTNSVAAFRGQLDPMMQAITGSSGMVKPTDYLDAIKRGSAAGKFASNDMFYKVLGHIIQESGGHITGTALMSAFQSLELGHMPQQTAEFLATQGLINHSQIKYGKTGHITKVLPGGLLNNELYQSDIFAWVMNTAVPKLAANFKAKNGRDATDRELELLITQLTANRTSGNQLLQFYMEHKNIRRQVEAYGKASNVNQAYDIANNSPQGQQNQLLAEYESMKRALGEQLLPLFNWALKGLLSFVSGLKWFAETFPAVTKYLLSFIAIMGTIALLFGALLVVLTTMLAPILAIRGAMFMLRLASGGLGGTLGSVAGGLNMLKMAAAAFIAWEIGQKIGSVIYDNMGETSKEGIGYNIAHLAAWLGNKEAQDAIATADKYQSTLKTNPKTVSKPPIKPMFMQGQQPYAPTAGAQVTQNFYGQTDPKKAGTEAQKALDAHERKKASNQRSALHDSE